MDKRKYVVTKDELGFYVLWVEYHTDGTFEPLCKRGLMRDIWERAYALIDNDSQRGITATLTFDLRGITFKNGQPLLDVEVE